MTTTRPRTSNKESMIFLFLPHHGGCSAKAASRPPWRRLIPRCDATLNGASFILHLFPPLNSGRPSTSVRYPENRTKPLTRNTSLIYHVRVLFAPKRLRKPEATGKEEAMLTASAANRHTPTAPLSSLRCSTMYHFLPAPAKRRPGTRPCHSVAPTCAQTPETCAPSHFSRGLGDHQIPLYLRPSAPICVHLVWSSPLPAELPAEASCTDTRLSACICVHRGVLAGRFQPLLSSAILSPQHARTLDNLRTFPISQGVLVLMCPFSR